MEHLSAIADLPLDKPIHILGAGAAGLLVLQALQAAGVEVAGFVDSYKAGQCAGLPIMHPDEAVERLSRDCAIVVVCSDWRSLGRRLARDGFTDVYNGLDFALRCQEAQRISALENAEERAEDCGGAMSLDSLSLDALPLSHLIDHAPGTDSLILQLSSRCNLRCVYCTQGLDSVENSTDIPPSRLESVISYILDHGIKEVHTGVFGETLIFKGWEEVSLRLIEAGVRLNGTTNLATVLTSEQAAVFSRYTTLFVSLDVLDVALQKTLRKAVDVRTIIFNIHLIRACAIADGRVPPKFIWNCVILDHNADRLVEYVAYAISCAADGVVLNDVAHYEGLKPGFRSLFELDDDAYAEAYKELEAALDLAARHNVPVDFPNNSDRRLSRRMANIVRRRRGEAFPDRFVNVTTTNIQGRQTYVGDRDGVMPGRTRICLDPWYSSVVMPTGEVHTCCVRGKSMGNIDQPGGLAAVMQGPEYRDLRRQLLTGELHDESCAKCLWRNEGSPEDLRLSLTTRLLPENGGTSQNP